MQYVKIQTAYQKDYLYHTWFKPWTGRLNNGQVRYYNLKRFDEKVIKLDSDNWNSDATK